MPARTTAPGAAAVSTVSGPTRSPSMLTAPWADEAARLAVARGEAGLDEQADEVDPAQIVDGHGGHAEGGLLALNDPLEV